MNVPLWVVNSFFLAPAKFHLSCYFINELYSRSCSTHVCVLCYSEDTGRDDQTESEDLVSDWSGHFKVVISVLPLGRVRIVGLSANHSPYNSIFRLQGQAGGFSQFTEDPTDDY